MRSNRKRPYGELDEDFSTARHGGYPQTNATPSSSTPLIPENHTVNQGLLPSSDYVGSHTGAVSTVSQVGVQQSQLPPGHEHEANMYMYMCPASSSSIPQHSLVPRPAVYPNYSSSNNTMFCQAPHQNPIISFPECQFTTAPQGWATPPLTTQGFSNRHNENLPGLRQTPLENYTSPFIAAPDAHSSGPGTHLLATSPIQPSYKLPTQLDQHGGHRQAYYCEKQHVEVAVPVCFGMVCSPF